VYPLPPQGTEISFRLSSGETITRVLISSRDWRDWSQRNYSGYGGFVSTTDVAFMEAFTRAQWADINITAPGGVSVAHTRLDLSELPAQLETMRNLRTAVQAAMADYQRECAPMHFEIH
jgi:hypothetical protein